MHRLEERSKPLLRPMIRGESQTVATLEDVTAISAWAAKTAMTLELAASGRASYIPSAHYRYLFERLHPPETCHVWCGSYHPDYEVEQRFRGASVNPSPWTAKSPLGVEVKGYHVAFNVGHLVFQITGHDSPILRHVEPVFRSDASISDLLIPLWPIDLGGLSWPPTLRLRPRDSTGTLVSTVSLNDSCGMKG
jgi:hypothetical protein